MKNLVFLKDFTRKRFLGGALGALGVPLGFFWGPFALLGLPSGVFSLLVGAPVGGFFGGSFLGSFFGSVKSFTVYTIGSTKRTKK